MERRPEFSLLETLRWEEDQGFWWLEEHLDRLQASAEYFGYWCDRADVRAALESAIAAATGRRIVRLEMARDGTVSIELSDEELPPIDAEDADPVRLAVSHVPVSSRNVFLFHKTTNRKVYQTRRTGHPDADDVVLINEFGDVTESTIANVLIRVGDEWFTPPLTAGLLPGVYRRVLLEKGTVTDAKVVASRPRRTFDRSAVQSIRKWRFKPRVVDGRPVPRKATQVIEFKLAKG